MHRTIVEGRRTIRKETFAVSTPWSTDFCKDKLQFQQCSGIHTGMLSFNELAQHFIKSQIESNIGNGFPVGRQTSPDWKSRTSGHRPKKAWQARAPRPLLSPPCWPDMARPKKRILIDLLCMSFSQTKSCEKKCWALRWLTSCEVVGPCACALPRLAGLGPQAKELRKVSQCQSSQLHLQRFHFAQVFACRVYRPLGCHGDFSSFY